MVILWDFPCTGALLGLLIEWALNNVALLEHKFKRTNIAIEMLCLTSQQRAMKHVWCIWYLHIFKKHGSSTQHSCKDFSSEPLWCKCCFASPITTHITLRFFVHQSDIALNLSVQPDSINKVFIQFIHLTPCWPSDEMKWFHSNLTILTVLFWGFESWKIMTRGVHLIRVWHGLTLNELNASF